MHEHWVDNEAFVEMYWFEIRFSHMPQNIQKRSKNILLRKYAQS